jgi:hypothetical protein
MCLLLIECPYSHRQPRVFRLAFFVVSEHVVDADLADFVANLMFDFCLCCRAEYEWAKEASQSLHVQHVVRFRTEQGTQMLHQQHKRILNC